MLDCVVPAAASATLLPVKRPKSVDLTQALKDNEAAEIPTAKHASSCPLQTPSPPSTPVSALSNIVQTNIQKFQKITVDDSSQLNKTTNNNTDALNNKINNDEVKISDKSPVVNSENENNNSQNLDMSPVGADVIKPARVAKVVDTSPKDKKQTTSLCKMRHGDVDPSNYEQISCVKVMSMSPTRGDGFAYLHTYRQKKRQE